MSMRRELTEKLQERTALLEKAEGFLKEGKREDYRSEMEKVRNMNNEINDLKGLIDEQDRKFMEKAPDFAEERDKAAERGNLLMKGEKISLSVPEVRRALWGAEKSVTLATGTIVQPTGAGSIIHDSLNSRVSSIVDQVYVENLEGMGALLEPYVITETDAKGGKVSTNAGTARTASADPTFGVAKIAPYELNVTNYVDRNISRLSPANYYAKIYAMAMRAMRRKLAELIVNGDGQSTPDMYGMKNAKNQAGSAIFATENLTAINENTLDLLFYAYGGDEEIAGNARLFLNKADLKAFGQIRGTADKNRVYKVHPDTGNPNIGMIEDGGNFVPYTIVSALTALSASTAGSSAIQTMLYGSPMNYLLGLFGPYSIRVDESVKAVERMYTILGDAMVGGNLVVHNGMVVPRCLRPAADMAIPEELRLVLAYCREPAPDEEALLALDQAWDNAAAYLAEAGVSQPPAVNAARTALWLGVMLPMVLDGYDQRGAQFTEGKLQDNPVFRRKVNQLKLTESFWNGNQEGIT